MNLAVLGAILHDIGKFAQRAGQPRSPLEHEYCPSRDGRYSHSHVLYTDYFIEKKVLLPMPDELEPYRSKIASLAASHHRADGKDRDHRAIQLADRLSSGMDRTESDTEGNFRKERMDSIFHKVRLDGKGVPKDSTPLKYQLNALGGKDSLFPIKDADKGNSYATLWNQFVAELNSLPSDLGERVWLSSLVSILEKYCWCVPSATYYSLPDISLFDHMTTTAAITQAILGCPEGEEKFLLFGGDLSGIQSFIFGREEPADKGAFKLIRARSFLLQAVTRSIWLVLLERLKLNSVAKIMDAGGRFILLLPDSANVRAELDKSQTEAEAWLYDNFLGAVRLNFARLPLKPDDLRKENFRTKFDEFNDALELAKLSPFSRILNKLPIAISQSEYEKYGEYRECAYCHNRPGSGIEDGKPVCAQCEKLIRLGQALPETKFIAFSREGSRADRVFKGLLFDKVNLIFYEDKGEIAPPEARRAIDILSVRGETIFTKIPVAGHMPTVTKKDIEEGYPSLSPGENWEPGRPKTFAMLADRARIPPKKEGDGWTSIACLGVLKADVDNLGMIFSMGFGDDFTVSHFAMLARMLNHFFAGYLTRVIREEYPDIYIVFAGGDDVFLIGPWERAISFGFRMAEDFRRFCGENQAVTISAGIPLVKAALPLRALREEAEEKLEQSKDYASGSGENRDTKNAATVFNVTAHWQEAEKSIKFGEKLRRLCETGAITRGFLRRLLGYSRECAKFFKGERLLKNGEYISKLRRDLESGSIRPEKLAKEALYYSHIQYDMARNMKTDREAEILKRELLEMAQNKEDFIRAELGISWAIYRSRISS